MPAHDWTKVPAGIFHHFHLEWIAAIAHALNHGLLPKEYYALAEQYAGVFGPDVLTLQAPAKARRKSSDSSRSGGASVLAKPRHKPIARTEMEFYRAKQKTVTVRHVSDDEIIALVEIVSPGNKSHRGRFRELVEKAAAFLAQGVHLSIIDLFPPSRRDPDGVHAAIWEEISGEDHQLPRGKKNRRIACYECGVLVQAYLTYFGIGDRLPDMPLFLEAGGCVEIPLEVTYKRAFAEVPARWRDELN
jgi:Protein of unknown function (DUF4058)